MNLECLNNISKNFELTGVEINKTACNLAKKKKIATIINSTIIEKIPSSKKYDLVFTKGVLIHINPNELEKVYKNIIRCKLCGSLKSNSQECQNCGALKEKFNKICVVEDIADQWSIQSSNIFQGYFHILGGTISSVGQRKEDLLINSLVNRVNKEKIDEVILANRYDAIWNMSSRKKLKKPETLVLIYIPSTQRWG